MFAVTVAPVDEGRLYALLAADTAPVGLIVLGEDGVVRHVNQTLATLLGTSPGFLTGRSFAEYVPDVADRLLPLVKEVQGRGRARRAPGLLLPLPDPAAETVPAWDVCCAPVPADPQAAQARPHAVALWLWPEEASTVVSRQTLEALRGNLEGALPAALPGFDVAAALVPSAPGTALGGDTYDVIDLGDGQRFALFVADVAGRGPAAAARAVLVRHSVRVLAGRHGPGETLTQLSSLLLADTSFSGFVTAFLGILDTRQGTLTYAFAGHEPALILQGSTGQVTALRGEGDLPLAVDDAARYDDQTTALTPRDTLLLYTDGLTDTRRAERSKFAVNDTFFDEERVRAALLRHRSLPAAALVATLLAEAAEFAGQSDLRDDTALLAVCGNEAMRSA